MRLPWTHIKLQNHHKCHYSYQLEKPHPKPSSTHLWVQSLHSLHWLGQPLDLQPFATKNTTPSASLPAGEIKGLKIFAGLNLETYKINPGALQNQTWSDSILGPMPLTPLPIPLTPSSWSITFSNFTLHRQKKLLSAYDHSSSTALHITRKYINNPLQ